MIDHQKPLGSGFGARSTATDVLADIDLTGKRAIVTGGYSGIGLEVTRALAVAGTEVIVAARNPVAAAVATKDIVGVTVELLDLSYLDSVRAFSEHILTSGQHIDVLINNAGIMGCPETRVGQGWEAQFATNHLGHFALTNALWPLLEGGVRIPTQSGRGFRFDPGRRSDLKSATIPN